MTQKTKRIRKSIIKLGFLEKFIEFQKFIDLRARAPPRAPHVRAHDADSWCRVRAHVGCQRNRKDMRHASFSSGTALEERPEGGQPETEREKTGDSPPQANFLILRLKNTIFLTEFRCF